MSHTLWLKQPKNPLYLDVSNTQGRPNVIAVDVSTDDSTNTAFMDKIPSNTNLLDISIALLDSSGGIAVTTHCDQLQRQLCVLWPPSEHLQGEWDQQYDTIVLGKTTC